ncbi:hypothetical protein [Sandaracinus amylolyticus]|uniref:Uncharacterized protein n=1 Tax=Sandaracinus amylolyticus TaxID=927083 RepID=A0A0F6SH80_9BACT|nr:hypothetical protein [Sandaracinus amylolyticus]AKF09979.1 hypothetical protein DB32_007128 [Sandaracinus amylolyticus]
MSAQHELETTARSLLELAERAQAQRPSEALVLADGAETVARASGARTIELRAARLGALVAYARGDLDHAEQRFQRASDAARAAGDPLAAARNEASVAFLAYDRGEPARAHDRLSRASRSLDALPADDRGVQRMRAVLDGYSGNLARQGGALDVARARYRAALTNAEAGDAAMLAMDLGATELAAGHHDDAALWLARASRGLDALESGPAHTLLAPLVAHYHALLALITARGGDVEIEGAASLAPIRTWLFDATRGGTERARIDASLRRRLVTLRRDARGIEHARFGVSLLERLVARSDDAREDVTVIARDGSLVVHDSVSADLSTREPLRRIVEALVHAMSRGDALSLAEIVAIGWPGERMRASAAKNRAHVALSTLRSLGLARALVRSARGYALDPRRVRIDR